jgi:hypothetical protein
LDSEESCLRSSQEEVNWAFGSEALGSMAFALGENGVGGKFEGAQNWWSHFVDTEQMQDYPIQIMGIEKEVIRSVPHTCNSPSTWACDCVQPPKETSDEVLEQRAAEYQVQRSAEHARHRQAERDALLNATGNATGEESLSPDRHQMAARDAQHAHGEGEESLSPDHIHD